MEGFFMFMHMPLFYFRVLDSGQGTGYNAVIDGWNVALSYDPTLGNSIKKHKSGFTKAANQKGGICLRRTVDWLREDTGLTPLIVGTHGLKTHHMDEETLASTKVVTLDKM